MLIKKTVITHSPEQSQKLGYAIGQSFKGSEIVVLNSDIGGGKTTFVKGLAKGMGSTENVQSPTFIISALYECANSLRLYHYDFYRLTDPGIMRNQLVESLQDDTGVTVIEWGEIVQDVLDKPIISITIIAKNENTREFQFVMHPQYSYINSVVDTAS